MRVLTFLLPFVLLVASTIGFVLGWHWDTVGRQLQMDYPNDWELKILGHAISNFGNTLECLGGIGVLVSIVLFGALHQLNTSLRRLRRLEAEVEWLRHGLPALSTPPSAGAGQSSVEGFFSQGEKGKVVGGKKEEKGTA